MLESEGRLGVNAKHRAMLITYVAPHEFNELMGGFFLFTLGSNMYDKN